jgi:hypothetical protein
MFSGTIVRYWSAEQTFGAANGVPLNRSFEGGIVRLVVGGNQSRRDSVKPGTKCWEMMQKQMSVPAVTGRTYLLLHFLARQLPARVNLG